MTWGEFKELIRVQLHEFARTHGVQTYIDTNIRVGVEDLMSAVPSLRRRNRTLEYSDLLQSGFAARAVLTPRAVISAVFRRLVSDPAQIDPYPSLPLKGLPRMIAGTLTEVSRGYLWDSAAGDLWVTPIPADEGTQLWVSFSTISADFLDEDEVFFGHKEANAVAEYVLTKLAINIDHDPQMGEVHQTLYRTAKRAVMSDANEAALSGAN